MGQPKYKKWSDNARLVHMGYLLATAYWWNATFHPLFTIRNVDVDLVARIIME